MSIVHINPGLIPIEGFTTFGINAKPATETAIGFFGTGLKYAISVILRNGGKIQLFIGMIEYEFFVTPTDFRGKEFDMVRMKKRNNLFGKWSYHAMPFTTELGKTWKVWQAFRELESNLRDEKGETYHSDEKIVSGVHGHTMFVITMPEYEEAFNNIGEVFLERDGLKVLQTVDGIEILDRPSKFIFYRGLRIMDLEEEEESKFTYNFLSQVDLTEDRTAKYPSYLKGLIARSISESPDSELIKGVVTAQEDSFEGTLEFDRTYGSPSEAFLKTVSSAVVESVGILPRVRTLFDRTTIKVESKISVSMYLRDWRRVVLAMEEKHNSDDIAVRAIKEMLPEDPPMTTASEDDTPF